MRYISNIKWHSSKQSYSYPKKLSQKSETNESDRWMIVLLSLLFFMTILVSSVLYEDDLKLRECELFVFVPTVLGDRRYCALLSLLVSMMIELYLDTFDTS